jgi:hypothetical protein
MTQEQSERICKQLIDYARELFKKENLEDASIISIIHDSQGIYSGGWGCRACDIIMLKKYITLEEYTNPPKHTGEGHIVH